MKKNIILSLVAASMIFVGCGEDSKKEESPKQEIKKEVVQPTTKQEPKVEAIKESPKPVVAKKEQKVEFLASKVFSTKCASCHGNDAKKSALGKSKIVANMTEPEIISALKGYKDGSYGGAMKTLMKGQISNFSEKELESLAKYMATLK
jgi:cytochrome c553